MTDNLKALDAAALLPCPFCGGQGRVDHFHSMKGPIDYYPGCDACDLWLDGMTTEAEAIAAWNTRAKLADDGAAVERVARAISTYTYATTEGHSDCLEWEDMRESDRNTYRRAATAALAAMREG